MNSLQVLHAPSLSRYWRDVLQRIGVPHCDWFSVPSDAQSNAVVFAVGSELTSAVDLGRLRTLARRGATMVLGGRAAAHMDGREPICVEVAGWVGNIGAAVDSSGLGLDTAAVDGSTDKPDAIAHRLFENCRTTSLATTVALDLPPATRARAAAGFFVLGTLHGADQCSIWPAVTITAHGSADVPDSDHGTRITLPLPEPDRLHPAAELRSLPLRTATTASGPDPSEIVAPLDHGALRRLVQNALREAFHSRDLPFVHTAAHPSGTRGMFAVRIDADGFQAPSSRRLLAMLEESRCAATWFLDVERHAQAGTAGRDWVRTLRAAGQEIQSHGFRHYTYRSTHRNRRNLDRASRWLRSLGIETTAAVAPFGASTDGFRRAAHQVGLHYTSEFARVFDERPGRFGDSVWQVPVHPVCPAIIRDASPDRSDEVFQRTVETHFRAYVSDALRRGDPAVIYGHPTKDLELVPELFRAVRAEIDGFERRRATRVWHGTISALHEFFALRACQDVTAFFHDGTLDVVFEGPAAVVVEWPRPASNAANDRNCDVEILDRAGTSRRPSPTGSTPRTSENPRQPSKYRRCRSVGLPKTAAACGSRTAAGPCPDSRKTCVVPSERRSPSPSDDRSRRQIPIRRPEALAAGGPGRSSRDRRLRPRIRGGDPPRRTRHRCHHRTRPGPGSGAGSALLQPACVARRIRDGQSAARPTGASDTRLAATLDRAHRVG